MSAYIQIISFEEPHLTGLVFEVISEFDNYYVVNPISDSTGRKLSSDLYSKTISFPLNTDKFENKSKVIDMLLKRTQEMLEFNSKN